MCQNSMQRLENPLCWVHKGSTFPLLTFSRFDIIEGPGPFEQYAENFAPTIVPSKYFLFLQQEFVILSELPIFQEILFRYLSFDHWKITITQLTTAFSDIGDEGFRTKNMIFEIEYKYLQLKILNYHWTWNMIFGVE